MTPENKARAVKAFSDFLDTDQARPAFELLNEFDQSAYTDVQQKLIEAAIDPYAIAYQVAPGDES